MVDLMISMFSVPTPGKSLFGFTRWSLRLQTDLQLYGVTQGAFPIPEELSRVSNKNTYNRMPTFSSLSQSRGPIFWSSFHGALSWQLPSTESTRTSRFPAHLLKTTPFSSILGATISCTRYILHVNGLCLLVY